MLKSNFIIAKCLLTVLLLTCSVEAVHFDCNFGMHAARPTGTRYTCEATVINSGSASLDRVTGIHQTWKSNNDVRQLRIHNQYLTFVPKGIAEFFKNLDALYIVASSLTTISSKDLRPFPRLLSIDLWTNQLSSIDGDLFIYTPYLQWVSFAANRIEHIGHDLVTSLKDLYFLHFYDNACIHRGAENRSEVLKLSQQLSILCPSLVEATTTDRYYDQCLCDEEIGELRELNSALGTQVDSLQVSSIEQNREIKQLIRENAALVKKMLEIEKKLRKL